MARKLRIVVLCAGSAAIVAAAGLWFAARAARQVRPFYDQALKLDPEILERGRLELESRATALYSDTRQAGKWNALFTDEQINGWLAVQLADRPAADGAVEGVRIPRIAISPGLLSLGFTTTQGSVETVVSVDASVFLTDEGDVAIRLLKVKAGALPLPVALAADKIALACQALELPIVWTQFDGDPVAMITIANEDESNGRQLSIDAIELNQGELYVSGHTELVTIANRAHAGRHDLRGDRAGGAAPDPSPPVNLDEFELRFASPGEESTLEIARRNDQRSPKPSNPIEE